MFTQIYLEIVSKLKSNNENMIKNQNNNSDYGNKAFP